ncbi:hypothetical protein [Alkalisalibacterium limincola]|uniref:hypothetical protein n=1 Tax=Alkalisalibacterium limincola TaxID=2699169 RepID=UPI00164F2C59|nr:hypothetical protein [Alkalisalibacterium limincola]
MVGNTSARAPSRSATSLPTCRLNGESGSRVIRASTSRTRISGSTLTKRDCSRLVRSAVSSAPL